MPNASIRPTVLTLTAAAGLAMAGPLASITLGQGDPLGEPFPAVFELSSVLPDGGGDGSLGFAVQGLWFEGQCGRWIDRVADWDGDGADELVFSVPLAGEVFDRYGYAKVLYGRRSPPLPAAMDVRAADGLSFIRTGYRRGRVVAGIGDMDGDGVEDVAIGMDNGGHTHFDVYLGNPAKPRGTFTFRSTGGRSVKLEGPSSLRAIESAGDVNGDGVEDVMISMPTFGTIGPFYSGVTYVLYGRSAGFAPQVDLGDLDGTDGFAMVGRAYDTSGWGGLCGGGDFNGDGIDDMAIGAPGAGDGAVVYDSQGRVYVVFGRPGTTDPFPASLDLSTLPVGRGIELRGDGVSGTGAAVDIAGDVNGDGVDDLIIADPDADAANDRAYIVFGRSDGAFPRIIDLESMEPSVGVRIQTTASLVRIARDVAGVGDVNGDGLDDFLVGGAPSSYRSNSAYLIYGQHGDWSATLDLASLNGSNGVMIQGASLGDSAGATVAAAGDINGDGVKDLGIGAPTATTSYQRQVGAVYVVYGRRPCTPDLDGDGELTIFDFLTFQNLFDAMDPAADFDGDGELTIFDFLAFQNAFDAGCP